MERAGSGAELGVGRRLSRPGDEVRATGLVVRVWLVGMGVVEVDIIVVALLTVMMVPESAVFSLEDIPPPPVCEMGLHVRDLGRDLRSSSGEKSGWSKDSRTQKKEETLGRLANS